MKWELKYYQGVLHPTLTTTYRSKKESKYILPNFHSKRAQELAGTLDCLGNLFQGREVHRWHQGMGISNLFYWLEEAIWKGENTEKGTPCSEHFVSVTVAMIRTLSREAGMFARTYWHARIWKKSGPARGFQEALHCIPQASNAEKLLLRNEADENYHIGMAPMRKARARQPKTLNFNKTPDVTSMYGSDSNGVFS